MKRMMRVIMAVVMAMIAMNVMGDSTMRTLVFVDMDDDVMARMDSCGARLIDSRGGVGIVDVRVDSMQALGVRYTYSSTMRLNRSTRVCLDSVQGMSGVAAAYRGDMLPHAFRGKGVILGIMDVGFDLSHPTFADAAGNKRFKSFWDMLDSTAVGTDHLPVGRAYEGEALDEIDHSTDSHLQFHAAHTLGIAAGTGADTPYRGMAPESEICAVNNAVSSDLPLVDSINCYMYTSATDALGFKYIFDYADRVGKPCVISFSEGFMPTYGEEERLMNDYLSALTGEGRIIVASSGNDCQMPTYMHKSAEQDSAYCRMYNYSNHANIMIATDGGPLTVTLADPEGQGMMTIDCTDMEMDSVKTDSVWMGTRSMGVRMTIERYHAPMAGVAKTYNVMLDINPKYAGNRDMALIVKGKGTDIQTITNSYNVKMQVDKGDAQYGHLVMGPAYMDRVIAVGATARRLSWINFEGRYKDFAVNSYVTRPMSYFSCFGPTLDGRQKPEVVANGMFVASADNSYYREAVGASDSYLEDVMAQTIHDGRVYNWFMAMGTSMSAPVVAGAVALWLEADPTLTPERVREVMERTCIKTVEGVTLDPQRCGYGEIDVTAGLLDILGISGMDELKIPGKEVTVTFNGRTIVVKRLRNGHVEMFDISGRTIALP